MDNVEWDDEVPDVVPRINFYNEDILRRFQRLNYKNLKVMFALCLRCMFIYFP